MVTLPFLSLPLPTVALPSLTTTLPVGRGPPVLEYWFATLTFRASTPPFFTVLAPLTLVVELCLDSVIEPIVAGVAEVQDPVNGRAAPSLVGVSVNAFGMATV